MEQPGAELLRRWPEPRPGARSLGGRGGPPEDGTHAAQFGAVVAAVVEPAVVTLEAHREFPAHVAYDGIGRRLEAIEFHPAYEVAGRAIWASGMLSGGREGPGPFELSALSTC